MTKAPQRPPLRRDAIVEAARDLIRREGADQLSLRRLAAAVGVTAPAFYAHIRSKGDLLEAIADAEFERLVERMEAIDTPDPVERLLGFARAYIDHAREEPALFEVMFLFAPVTAGMRTTDTVALASADRAFAIPLATVEEAIAAGTIAPADPLIVALSLWTSAHGLASALLLGMGLPSDLEEALIEEATGRMLRGWRP